MNIKYVHKLVFIFVGRGDLTNLLCFYM